MTKKTVVTENGMSFCTLCHTQVVWAKSKAGKNYVADRGYRGAPVGPHFKTCERLQAANASARR